MISNCTNLIRIAVPFTCLFMLGCSTKIITTKATTENKIQKGIKYHLPADIFTIKTKNINLVIREIDECLQIKTSPVKTIYEIDPVIIETVADTSHFHTLSLTPGWFSTDTLLIERLNNKPLLKKIDFSSDGKAGEVAVNTVKTIATISGAVSGLNVVNLPSSSSQAMIEGLNTNTKIINSLFSNISASCNVNINSRLNRLQNYAINNSSQAKRIWGEVIDSELASKNIVKLNLSQLKKLEAENNKDKLAIIKDKLKIFNAELIKHNKKTDELLASFIASVKIIAKEKEIGLKKEQIEYKRMFHADELLTSDELKECSNKGEGCKGELLKTYNEYSNIHYAITLDAAFDSNITSSPYKASSNEKWFLNSVYVRDSLPYKYSVHSINN